MKKKHRDITVADVKYGWTIRSYGKETFVTVWLNKKPWHKETFRQESVTPKDVREMIEEKLKQKS